MPRAGLPVGPVEVGPAGHFSGTEPFVYRYALCLSFSGAGSPGLVCVAAGERKD